MQKLNLFTPKKTIQRSATQICSQYTQYTEYTECGSALVIILIVTSVLSLFCILFWQSSSLFSDVSLAKVTYEQNYRAAEAGLNCAMLFCKTNFDLIMKQAAQKEFGQPAKSSTQVYSSRQTYEISFAIENKRNKLFITLSDAILPDEPFLHIRSELFDLHNKRLVELSCDLLRVRETVKVASQKQHNKGGGQKNKKQVFCIKNWRIGE